MKCWGWWHFDDIWFILWIRHATSTEEETKCHRNVIINDISRSYTSSLITSLLWDYYPYLLADELLPFPVLIMAFTAFQSLKSFSRACLLNFGGSKSCSGMSWSKSVVGVFLDPVLRDLEWRCWRCSTIWRPTVCKSCKQDRGQLMIHSTSPHYSEVNF